MIQHKSSCLRLFKHDVLWALSLDLLNAGRSMAAKIAITAMTTNSSISVKPWPGAPGGLKYLEVFMFWLSPLLFYSDNGRPGDRSITGATPLYYFVLSESSLAYCVNWKNKAVPDG